MAADSANSGRFATINSEEFQELIKAKDSASTQRSTEVGVRIFRAYLKEKELDPDFESYSKDQLAKVLTKFYVEVRRENGDNYKTGSLINIRAAVNRHLKSSGHVINIIIEPVFAQANLAFSAKQANLKRGGYGDTQHYPPIDENDIDKLYRSGIFDEDTPSGLQSKVWFELMYYICRRGRENLRKLEKDHFAITEDSNGRRYVYQCKDEMSKKIRGDNMKSRVDAGRMYATDGDGCPVASFEKYISKLNPNNSALFQAPLKSAPCDSEKPWYKNAPLGEKQLGNFMSRLSLAAGLSRRYTNHSLRSTCITVLDESGFDSRDICNVSGHRNERSIRTYVGRPNDAKKQKLSDALSSSIGYVPPRPTGISGNDKPSTSKNEKPSTSGSEKASQKPSRPCVSKPPVVPLDPNEGTEDENLMSQSPEFQIEMPMSPILSSSQLETLEELTVQVQRVPEPQALAVPSNMIQQSSLHTSRVIQRQIQPMAQQPFTFNNCNVTINYNYQN